MTRSIDEQNVALQDPPESKSAVDAPASPPDEAAEPQAPPTIDEAADSPPAPDAASLFATSEADEERAGVAVIDASADASEGVLAASEPTDDRPPPPFDRDEFLAPFVEPIAAAIEHHAEDSESGLVVAFDGRELEIDSWSRQVVAEVLDATDGTRLSAYRIVEALALRAKIHEDLQRCKILASVASPGADFEAALVPDAGDEEREAERAQRAPDHLQEELTRDAALGLAILAEIQKVIDATVVSGNIQLAKSLTGFRPPFHHAVNDVRELLNEHESSLATQMSETLVRTPEDIELPRVRRKKKRRRKDNFAEFEDGAREVVEEAPKVEKPSSSRRRTRAMVFLFVALVGIWGALLVPRLLKERLPELEARDFGYRGIVQKVIARPPSLYVTIDTQSWDRLSERERVQMVEDFAFDLSKAGYSGARFATPNGHTVARWLKARGAELVKEEKAEE